MNHKFAAIAVVAFLAGCAKRGFEPTAEPA
jgi:hypothetical protein